MATILTDIEGTTSSLAFVKDVLFPYARERLPAFVREHAADPDVRGWLDAVAAENGGICSDDMIAEMLQGWIDQDRKHIALKALQGMIWRDGYAQGAFRGHVYPDAAQALRDWHADGHALAVFSSGSVEAQRLLFGHSDAGDLSALFSGFFDTGTGAKREQRSYQQIARALGTTPDDILFLSDIVPELDAARDAGLQTVLLDRPADYPRARTGDATGGHRRDESFAAIHP